MHELTPKIVAILARYTEADAGAIADATALCELDIDQLDMPMIALDIEDALDVCICLDEQLEQSGTVADLVACAVSSIEARALQRQLRLATPRVKRTWLSNEAEQRR